MKDTTQKTKTLYKVVLNDNSEPAIIGSLDDCCAYAKRLYGEETAIKKIMDDGILIKPAREAI